MRSVKQTCRAQMIAVCVSLKFDTIQFFLTLRINGNKFAVLIPDVAKKVEIEKVKLII